MGFFNSLTCKLGRAAPPDQPPAAAPHQSLKAVSPALSVQPAPRGDTTGCADSRVCPALRSLPTGPGEQAANPGYLCLRPQRCQAAVGWGRACTLLAIDLHQWISLWKGTNCSSELAKAARAATVSGMLIAERWLHQMGLHTLPHTLPRTHASEQARGCNADS